MATSDSRRERDVLSRHTEPKGAEALPETHLTLEKAATEEEWPVRSTRSQCDEVLFDQLTSKDEMLLRRVGTWSRRDDRRHLVAGWRFSRVPCWFIMRWIGELPRDLQVDAPGLGPGGIGGRRILVGPPHRARRSTPSSPAASMARRRARESDRRATPVNRQAAAGLS